MAPARTTLHGNVRGKHKTALLVIDMLNDLEFKGGKELFPKALEAAKTLKNLLARARKAKVPVIYVNDNFGHWTSDFHAQIKHCLEKKARGAPIVQMLAPSPDDYYVLKPKHSGFYASPLALLLEYMGTENLIFSGLTLESCVYFTAADAYLHDYKITLVADCLVSKSASLKRSALIVMQESLKARVRNSTSLRF